MAVKPITNKQVVSREAVNRGEQVSTRGLTDRTGNKSTTIIPGPNITENYSITLKDIDTSILNYIKNVMSPTLKEANEQLKVPVYYGNEERWKNYRKRGVLRDKQGALILPLIMFRRTDVMKDTERQQPFKHDVQRENISVVRNSQWSKTNRYDRFAVQFGKKPVRENILTGMPEYFDITYEFVLWTNYIEQMNILAEDFLHQSNTYWGDSSDRKFLAKLESMSDASEMSQDSERFIKTTFSLVVKSYLLPEYVNSVITNKISQVKKELTPSTIVFGYEGDATDEQVGK
jgi:hypothetical protein